MATHECYITMLEIDNHLQTMSIEKQWTVAKPIEGLEEILLEDSRPERNTSIGTLASLPVYQAFTTFLRENRDVFAWSHEDMPEINSSIMVHKLNMSPSFPLSAKKIKCLPKNKTWL